MRLLARGGAVLAAALVVVSVLSYLAPLRLVSYRLVVEAAVPSVPGARGPLFGWAELVATAPGARPLTLVKPLKPGQRAVTFNVDATGLVRASRRTVSSARGVLAEALRGEASSVAVVMFLYDSRGNHYIASAVLGSYEVALARLHDPLKAAKLVSRDPYLVLHAGHIALGAQMFSVVNVTGLYRSIVEKYYRSPQPRAPGTRVAPAASLRLPRGCTPVTIDNYRSYSLSLTSSDFIVLPGLYNAQPPPSFYQHLQGVPRAYKTAAYRFMARHYSTAVYVPADTCSLPWALQAALEAWYDPASREATPMAGLLALQDFWERIAGPSVQWVDASKGHVEKIARAPLLRIMGVCQADCSNDNIVFNLAVAATSIGYHESGVNIAGIIVIPKLQRSLKVRPEPAVASMLPSYFNSRAGFIIANVTLKSDGDGVFIDYYVTRETIYDALGRPHQYWKIVPVIAFLPFQDVHVDWASLSQDIVSFSSKDYIQYYNKYYELVGITRPGYIQNETTITATSVLDTTSPEPLVATSYAGAVIGLAQSLMGVVLSVVLGGGSVVSTIAGVAGSLFSYAYTSWGADAVTVKLIAQYPRGLPPVHAEIVKMVPYSVYPKPYFLGQEKSWVRSPSPYWKPIFMTYFIVYKGRS